MNDDFISQKEAAKFAKTSVQNLIKWRKTDGLKFYKVGGKVLYKQCDILAFFDRKALNILEVQNETL